MEEVGLAGIVRCVGGEDVVEPAEEIGRGRSASGPGQAEEEGEDLLE